MGNYVGVLDVCCRPCNKRGDISHRDNKKPLTASEMTSTFKKMYESNNSNNITLESKNKMDPQLYFFHDSVLIGKLTGNPIDKYTIDELIVKGKNNSLIYKATLKSNGEKRILKIIPKNKKNIQKNQSLIKEIELLEQIDNPYIIKLYEFYDCPKVICLVNEYCNGGNLNNRLIIERQFTELNTAIIIFQILSALSFCHSKNIIHRNLTLSHILINENKKDNFIHIKIIDFSSSTKVIKGIDMGDSVGNLKYTSPEVFEGKYNETRDIWSVGIIMYKLLTGDFPFENKDILKLKALIEICNVDYKKYPLNIVNKECINLMKQLLKKDKGRISAKDALNHNWFKILNIKEKLTYLSFEQIQKILNNIFYFKPKKILQKLCIEYLTRNLKNEEIDNATNLFCQIDVDNDGEVEEYEFIIHLKEIINKLGEEIEEEYLKNLFSNIDIDQSGNISYSEFVSAAIDKKIILTDEYLKESFDFFDKNKKGIINIDDLVVVFKKFPGFSIEEFNEMFNEFDVDGNGEINFEEYKGIMKSILKNE